MGELAPDPPRSRRRERHDRFIAELEGATLVRNLGSLRRTVAMAWNALTGLHQGAGLRSLSVPPSRFVSTRTPWQVSGLVSQDVEHYLTWASVPDPLAVGARARALAPLSLRLQSTHIHSAASAAAAAGIPLDRITSLARLIEPKTFRTLGPSLRRTTQAVRLHPWRCRNAHCDCFGMGKGIP